MANTTIYVKGPDFSGQIAAPAVTIDPIPNNISQAQGTTLDMSQYINDPGGVRTSTEVLTNGNPLPDPWFVSYDPVTEELSFDTAGQATGLKLRVTYPGGTVDSNVFEAAVTTAAVPLWAGDYEDGTFAQWPGTSTPASGYRFGHMPPYGRPIQYGDQLHTGDGSLCEIVRSSAQGIYNQGEVFKGDYACKFTIKNSVNGSEPDDCDQNGSTCYRRRTELQGIGYLPTLWDEIKHRQERWIRRSVYLPSDWSPTGSGWGVNLLQIKEENGLSSPHVAIEATGGDVWEIYHRWFWTYLGNTDPAWHSRYGFFYTGDYDGQPYPRSDFWPDGLAHYPNEAASVAALQNVYKGGWTHWVIKVRFDERTLAQGGTGYLKVWKKDNQGWTHILDIAPGSTTRQGATFDYGIGLPGTHSGWNAGMYTSKELAWNSPVNLVSYQDCDAIYNGSALFSEVSPDGTVPAGES